MDIAKRAAKRGNRPIVADGVLKTVKRCVFVSAGNGGVSAPLLAAEQLQRKEENEKGFETLFLILCGHKD